MMCDLAQCRGEGTRCLQFHGGRTQLCFSKARVPVRKMFDSQSVQVPQTPCEQFPLHQKKMMSMDFTLDLFIQAFFGQGDWEVCHSELCLLVVGSYSKTQVSSPVITHCRKSGSLHTWSKSTQETNTRVSFCSSDKFFGTSFAQIFLMCRSSIMIWWTSVFAHSTSVPIQNSLHTSYIVLSSWSWRTPCVLFVLNTLPSVLERLVPPEDLGWRQNSIPISCPQQLQRFRTRFSKFCTELDCLTLLQTSLHFRPVTGQKSYYALC